MKVSAFFSRCHSGFIKSQRAFKSLSCQQNKVTYLCFPFDVMFFSWFLWFFICRHHYFFGAATTLWLVNCVDASPQSQACLMLWALLPSCPSFVFSHLVLSANRMYQQIYQLNKSWARRCIFWRF